VTPTGGGAGIDRGRTPARAGAPILATMTARKAAAGLFGAFVGAWLGRAAFKWILDLPGDWWLAATAVCAVIGAAVAVAGEHEAQAKAARE
jgi:uncharacterized membrane protein YeaQ/YmgE (transglycosylase-associated protein family)